MREGWCDNCDKKFLYNPSNRMGKYCSFKCRNESYKGKGNPNYKNVGIQRCILCGEEFKSYDKRRKYCSAKCFYSTHRSEIECTYCKKKFITYKSRKIGAAKFCSITCYKKYNREINEITKICKNCNKEFVCLKRENRTFCSTKCFHTHRSILAIKRNTGVKFTEERIKNMSIAQKESGNWAGNKNPHYVDGRHRKGRNYRGEDWKEKKLLALKRDNYTCQKCGSKKVVAVHHIVPYYNLRSNDLIFLITLCQSCHPKCERSYNFGRRKFKFIGKECEITKDIVGSYHIKWRYY